MSCFHYVGLDFHKLFFVLRNFVFTDLIENDFNTVQHENRKKPKLIEFNLFLRACLHDPI